MGSRVFVNNNQLEIDLTEAGNKLLNFSSLSSAADISTILLPTEHNLSSVPQSPPKPLIKPLHQIINALVAKDLMRHPDMYVNISVACCICQILRITAPNAPYNHEQIKDFFELVVLCFEKLSSASGEYYGQMTKVLEVFSKARLPILMLDLKQDGHGLTVRLFKHILNVSDSNSTAIVLHMEKIMTMLIEESEELAIELQALILASMTKDNQSASPVCWQFGEKVLMICAAKLKPIDRMSIAVYDYPKMVAQICRTTSEMLCNNHILFHGAKETIPFTYETSKMIDKIKLECPATIDMIQTLRHCKDTSMALKSVTEMNGKRKRNNEQGCKLSATGKDWMNRPDTAKILGPKTGVDRYTGLIQNGCNLFLTQVLHHQVLVNGSKGIFRTVRTIRDVSILIKLTFRNALETNSAENAIIKQLIQYTADSKVKERKTEIDAYLSQEASLDEAQSDEHGQILVGRKIRVWRAKDEIYRPGVVKSFDCIYKLHKVLLDDGFELVIDLKLKRWMFDNFSAIPDSSAGPAPREVSSPQSGIICVQGYKVKNVYAPILEAIFKKHGDIAAKCVFTNAAMRTPLVEAVCDIVGRIETSDVTNIISNMKEIESQVYVAEAAKMNVSWLRAHLEAICKMNEAGKKVTMLMELKTNTILVKKAAGTDLRERYAKLVAAQNQFAEAQRCVEVLNLVENKLNNNVLESKAEKDLWAGHPII
ncbi:phospholipase-like protein [Artemisia annua]|uniref:Phospholipase-like protein n=1 Tax=Artemisia annua TaxID=35608 RepID=A0A2U1M1V8_ARTAN|nr:phospholipase-like protein [Artemisia annua]